MTNGHFSDYTTKLQVRNSCALKYRVKQWSDLDRYIASDRFRELMESREIKTYSGNVKDGSRKAIKKAVDILLQVVPDRVIYNPVIKQYHHFKVGFVTLTMPFNDWFVDGKTAYKQLLKPFLEWLRKTKKCNTYIWKAERQKPIDKEGNYKASEGQIHYHITIPVFIHFAEIRDKWNTLLYNNMYLSEDDRNPNSTDVHSVKNVKDLEGYLIKYIAKINYSHYEDSNNNLIELPKAQNGKHYIPDDLPASVVLCNCIEYGGKIIKLNSSVEGKVWDCSNNLSETSYFSFEMQDENYKRIIDVCDIVAVRVVELDNGTMYYTTEEAKIQFLTIEQATKYHFWKQKILDSIHLEDGI